MVQQAPFALVDGIRLLFTRKCTLLRVWALDAGGGMAMVVRRLRASG